MAKILKAAVKVDKKVYTGKSHGEAMEKAKAKGEDLSKLNREKHGKFTTSDKRLLSRKQAKKEFGITHSHQIPHQRKK